ncbi:MAG: 3-hydroxybutyryl-CoA dehydrogenase [Alphaproteobacteria bacterium]|nr:3-hydroxybutyryl-CoA dehydrogenase [Alphaproteobacteria bacterium]
MIGLVGAGRMGRGLAVVFAYAGHEVALIDVKQRSAVDFARLVEEAHGEIARIFETLARLGLLAPEDTATLAARVRVVAESEAASVLPAARFIFEGVPEVLDLKRQVLARVSRLAGAEPILASTTSTILVDYLAGPIEHPERFLNAHWLNPPYLMPLVELSPGAATRPDVVQAMRAFLDGIGKVTVLCAARPGYIVPRIQALAMNEAARMVEEGVASAEEIDKAVKYGFGLRFAVLGLLEFIDWGGGDILYYASRYLTEALGNERYAAPEIVERNMREGHIGMKAGRGFLDYGRIDIERHRLERLGAFAALLRDMGLVRPPVL